MEPPNTYLQVKKNLWAWRSARQAGSALSLGALLLVALLGAGNANSAETLPSKEQQIKAAFLVNFVKFVEWPASTFSSNDSPVIIGILGKSAYCAEVEKAAEGKKVNGHPVIFKCCADIAAAQNVHLLFIPASAENRLAESLKALASRPIVTVGETRRFAESDGMITFVLEGDKIRFEINGEAAENVGVPISAQLLKLAKTVRKGAKAK
ncbi:MAG TPA: YfiR family protein [Verrucomicrobiae bacterium]|jgi:hypothetical protein